MTRRATFTAAEIARAQAIAAAGFRATLQRGDTVLIVEPAHAVPASEPDSALDGWIKANGGRVEGAA